MFVNASGSCGKKVTIQGFFWRSKNSRKTERSSVNFPEADRRNYLCKKKAQLVPAIRAGPVEVHPQPCVAPRHSGPKRKLLLRSSAAHGSKSSSQQASAIPATQIKLEQRSFRTRPPIVCASNVCPSIGSHLCRVASTIHCPEYLLQGGAEEFRWISCAKSGNPVEKSGNVIINCLTHSGTRPSCIESGAEESGNPAIG
jgi:hypothetical protein